MAREFEFIHHYSPKSRIRNNNVIVIRHVNSPFYLCEQEVNVIYDKVRRLLNTVETWLEYSLDDDIKKETVRALHISVNKTLAVATKDIEELINHHQLTNKDDVDTLKDVAVQLQEIADDIFKSYIMQ